MDDVFTLKSSAFPATARVLAFRGREEVSHPYAFEIHLFLPGDDAKSLDLGDAIGLKATLASHADWHAPFTFQGILTTVELVHAFADFALFRVVLAPRFTRLGLTLHSRLFTQKSVPDILKAVFEENGLAAADYDLRLTASYPTEEHVCQYHESDLAFVSRWMEHLGMYYWFEQGDDAEKLVVTDALSSQTDLPTDPVRYVPTLEGDHSAGAALETFRSRATSLPASVKLKDYDYTKPTLDVSASAPVASNGVGEIAVYGARFFTPSDAQSFAKLRAEEMLARQLEQVGGGTAFLRAGYQFTVEEHPMDAMNQKYLAVACEHFGNLSAQSPQIAKRIPIAYAETYHCDVSAIPASVQFRPKRETPTPRIYGLEHGLIDGEQTSDYAQIDDKGRYKVKFFFDESDLKDGAASTWVRQMQPHGGGVEGFHFPLRKGTEVVLSFLGGDPDRPVIAGVVNTTTTPSPVTSANNTRNVIQTGGRNRFEMEDQDGIQKISVSTPTADTFLKMGATDGGHELTIHTAANSLHQTDANHDHIVGAALTETVTGPVTETYSATHTTVVAGAHSLTISGPRTVKVGAAHDVTITGPHTETVNGAHTQHFNATSTRTVLGSETDTVVGTATRVVTSTTSETMAANYNHTVGAAMVQKIGGAFTQKIGGAMKVEAPAATDWNIGPLTFKVASSNHFNADAHVGMTIGATSDTFIGLKNSNNLAIAVTLNASSSLTLSVSSDVTLAKSIKATFGPTVELHQNTAFNMSCTAIGRIKAGGGMNITAGGGLILKGAGPCSVGGAIVRIA